MDVPSPHRLLGLDRLHNQFAKTMNPEKLRRSAARLTRPSHARAMTSFRGRFRQQGQILHQEPEQLRQSFRCAMHSALVVQRLHQIPQQLRPILQVQP